MAELTRTDLLALALDKLPNNSSRAITPALLREVVAALVESGFNLTDDVELLDTSVADGAITIAKLNEALINGPIGDGDTNKVPTNEQVKTFVNDGLSNLSDAVDALLADKVSKDGTVAMTGQLSLVGDPSADSDAARKKYVDDAVAVVNSAISTAVAGMKWKDSARAVITGSESLIGTYITADIVSLNAGDRVVRNSVSSPALNGIYVVAAGAWTRATDADNGTELKQATVAIMEGTSNADKIMMVSNDGTINLGSTAITWVTIGQATSYTAGTGLSLSGTVFSVDSTVQLRTTTVASQSGSAISFDSPRQDLTTSAGGATVISITSFTNTGIGKRVLWMITSQHASDTLSISVAGATILNQGFSFVPNVVNLVYLTHIGTSTYTLTISPNV